VNLDKLVEETILAQRKSKQRGVRLHHPSKRSCTWLVTEPRRYPDPFPCPRCRVFHTYKTHHLDLNEHGDVCVSQELYDMFKAAGILDVLKATKEVTPRPNFLGLPEIPLTTRMLHGNQEDQNG
jgi:hypothetical protein